ncbi:hypothetical protein J4G08_16330 [Candidatus Poribacteria bacterium]|nr:hypothetical protein [Candidatus Poribacteria bacterium]
MLFQKKKHGGQGVAPTSIRSQDTHPDSQNDLQQTTGLLPDAKDAPPPALLSPPQAGASDAALQHFLDNPHLYEISTAPNDNVLKLRPDFQHPRPEDFSSGLDYNRAALAFYEKRLSKTEIPEGKEIWGNLIADTKEYIAAEEAEIAEAEETREEAREWKEQEAKMIELNVSFARRMMTESDDYWNLYLDEVVPRIPSSIRDAVLEKFLSEQQTPEASDAPPFSDVPRRLVESREGGEVVKPPSLPVPMDEMTLSDQIGGWNEALIKAYPDIFAYPDAKSREAFSQKLPSEGARQYFRERQTALHKEYAALLQTQLKGVPKEKREQAIVTVRQSLLQKWDADFADAVMRQLQQEK